MHCEKSQMQVRENRIQKLRRRREAASRMLRIGISWTVAFCLAMLTACGGPGEKAQTVSSAQAESTASAETQTSAPVTEQEVPKQLVIPEDLPPVDVDLSVLSQTMMYSQAYDMIYNPDSYIGKTVRMKGPFGAYDDAEGESVHHAILIRDATACCTQGIEFELPDTDVIYPQQDEIVLVSGTFDTYMQGMFLFCILRDATIEAAA